jgi:hypothetical protein
MGNIAWNEPWNGFSMTSNNDVASSDPFGGFATNDTALAGMELTHQHHQPSSTTGLYNLPEEPTLWTSNPSGFQNNDYAFQSSAPTEAQNYPNFDTLQQTAPGSSQWRAQGPQLQGSSMIVDSVLPAEGHQSG